MSEYEIPGKDTEVHVVSNYSPEKGDLIIPFTDWNAETCTLIGEDPDEETSNKSDTEILNSGESTLSHETTDKVSETFMKAFKVFTMYKRVDQKVKPVSGTFPEEARVRRTIPEDPLITLPKLPEHPPIFTPGTRLTQERMEGLKINTDSFLTKEEECLFQHVFKLNELALAFEDEDRGTLKQSYFSDYIMPTIPHTPWEYKNIPIPPGIRDKVIEVLKNKIKAGAYEPSQSSYRGKWFCVLKKNGSLRIVHDLQPLNKVSIRDAGLLPIIDDFVESFAGHQCYTVFDLFWGFDARIVDERSRDMTAFYSPLGLLRLTALPTGYTNSPAEFQNCMVFILKEEIPNVANVFIDDLPIKGPSSWYEDKDGKPETIIGNKNIRRFIWEHANDVHRIMHKIRCAGATFSAKKTQVCRPEVLIVGQKCSKYGREPDKDRIEKILSWPIPQNVTELRGFLGICGTVRIWIKDYSKIIRPLIWLLRKDAKYLWTGIQQQRFEKLKILITTAPVLRPIDYKSDRPIYLSVDTSRHAVGFILSQEDSNGKRRPARYGSLPMNQVEFNYSQPKLELYGLFKALRHWSLYLIGTEKRLKIELDAKFIKDMLNRTDLDPKAPMNRWIQGILMFDFELIHIPGKNFKGPDGLSRKPRAENEKIEDDDDDFWVDKVYLLSHIPNAEKAIHFDQRPVAVMPYKAKTLPSADMNTGKENQNIRRVHEYLRTLRIPLEEFTSAQAKKHFLKKVTQYYLHPETDQMFKRNSGKTPQLVIQEPDKKIELISQAHDELGHKGEQVVYELLRSRFYWPYQRSDVHFHLASCVRCQLRSTIRLEIPPTVSTTQYPFQKVYIDVMKMPESGGFSWIVSCKDDLTGAIEARALRNNQSRPMAKFFWEEIYCRYGAVQQVTTDNGAEVAGAFERLLDRLNIPQVKVVPYNKHANGVVERSHAVLREALVKSSDRNANGDVRNWHLQLPIAVFADRITISHVTGYSPYYLLHGTEPLLPFDLTEATFLVEGFRKGMSTVELLQLRIRQLQRLQQDTIRASEILKRSRFRAKEQFMRRFEHRLQFEQYNPGDLVLIRNTSLEMNVTQFKTKDRYLGPYEIVRRTTRGNYVVKELDGSIRAAPFAAFRVIPYISRTHDIMKDQVPNKARKTLEGAENPDQLIRDESQSEGTNEA